MKKATSNVNWKALLIMFPPLREFYTWDGQMRFQQTSTCADTIPAFLEFE
jgi:hypothetical protein